MKSPQWRIVDPLWMGRKNRHQKSQGDRKKINAKNEVPTLTKREKIDSYFWYRRKRSARLGVPNTGSFGGFQVQGGMVRKEE